MLNWKNSNLVFSRALQKNTHTWNFYLEGCYDNRQFDRLVKEFQKMDQQNIQPNEKTFKFLLESLGSIGDFDTGDKIIEKTKRMGIRKELDHSIFLYYIHRDKSSTVISQKSSFLN